MHINNNKVFIIISGSCYKFIKTPMSGWVNAYNGCALMDYYTNVEKYFVKGNTNLYEQYVILLIGIYILLNETIYKVNKVMAIVLLIC